MYIHMYVISYIYIYIYIHTYEPALEDVAPVRHVGEPPGRFGRGL